MAGYHGGQTVKEGFYLKRSTWEFVSIAREGGILPDNKKTSYRKLPLPTVMVAGPLLGLAYVIFVPILYCLSLGYIFTRLIGQKIKVTRQKDSVLADNVR